MSKTGVENTGMSVVCEEYYGYQDCPVKSLRAEPP